MNGGYCYRNGKRTKYNGKPRLPDTFQHQLLRQAESAILIGLFPVTLVFTYVVNRTLITSDVTLLDEDALRGYCEVALRPKYLKRLPG